MAGPLPPGPSTGPSSRSASLAAGMDDPYPPPLPASDNSLAEPDNMEADGGTPGSVTPAPPLEALGGTFLPEGVALDTSTGAGWGASQGLQQGGTYQDPQGQQDPQNYHRSPQQPQLWQNGNPAAQQAGSIFQEHQPQEAINPPPLQWQPGGWGPGPYFSSSQMSHHDQGQSGDPMGASGGGGLGGEGTFRPRSAAGGGWGQGSLLQSSVGVDGQSFQHDGGQVHSPACQLLVM